jgi:DNA-binding GntR family transcriptional regulator
LITAIRSRREDEDRADTAGVVLADKLASAVQAAEAVPGTVFASENELRETHCAGRSVFRQAVRILEERGIAYMRRGVGGGLVVAEPNAAFAARALSILIESRMTSVRQIGVLAATLDAHVFLRGAPKLDLETCQGLRRLSRRLDRLSNADFLRQGAQRQLRAAVRSACGEPAVVLLDRASSELTIDLIPYSVIVAAEGNRGDFWRLTQTMVEALIAGDAAALFECRRLQQDIFAASYPSWEAIERDPSLAPKFDDPARPGFEATVNQAERLAREILREIRRLDWTPDARIGGGAELMERYGASGGIVRQAVRMLQEHAAVRVERGRNGGLFVGALDSSAILERAAAFLRRAEANPADVRMVLVQLMLELLEQGARWSPAQLRGALGGGEAPAGEAVQMSFPDLCLAFVRLSGNPAAQVAAQALAPMLATGRAVRAPLNLQALVQSLGAGDVAQSRRILLEYAQAASGI